MLSIASATVKRSDVPSLRLTSLVLSAMSSCLVLDHLDHIFFEILAAPLRKNYKRYIAYIKTDLITGENEHIYI